MNGEQMSKNDYHFPQIKKGDQLFTKSLDPWHNAIINGGDIDLVLYSTGYKRAADLLTEHILKTRKEQDYLIFPILFLYRHFIELNLKILIRLGNAIIDVFEKYPHHHKIYKLWIKYRKIYLKILDMLDNQESEADLDTMDNLINQFSKIDPCSIDTRYPENKEGKKSLSGLKHVDFLNLKKIMDGIDSFFSGSYAYLSDILNHKRDFESYYSGSVTYFL
jgi:hypothetical protein